MATHSSTLAWKIPWIEERGKLQSMGVTKSQTRLSDFTFNFTSCYQNASQMVLVVKNLPANAGGIKDVGSVPASGKMPWRSKWQPTPLFLPGESHGQRSLVGYSPWSHKEAYKT